MDIALLTLNDFTSFLNKVFAIQISDEISFSEFSTEEALTQNYGSNAKGWVKQGRGIEAYLDV